MDILANLLKTLLILGVLLILLETLLPKSTYRPYLKIVGGLLVILFVMQAANGLLGRDQGLQAESQAAWEQVLADGLALSAQNQEQADQIYQKNLQEQLPNLLTSSLLELNKVEAEVDDKGQLQGLKLFLSASGIEISPTGQASSRSQAELEEADRLARQAAVFCGLPETAVQVRWLEE